MKDGLCAESCCYHSSRQRTTLTNVVAQTAEHCSMHCRQIIGRWTPLMWSDTAEKALFTAA